MTSNPMTAPGDSRSLKERLQRLEQDLIRQRQRTNATTTLTAIVGIIVLIAVGIYFGIGYTQIKWAIEPDRVVETLGQKLDDNIPVVRKQLEDEIKKSAPQWAATLSKEALGQLPVARQQLERLTTQYLDENLQNTQSMTEEHFRSFLTKNKADLQKKFDELEKNEFLAEASLADVEQELNKEFQTNLKAESDRLLRDLTSFNTAFKKVREGKDLNEEQKLWRQSVMIARSLRTQPIDFSNTGIPAANSSGVIRTSSPAGKGSLAKPGARDDQEDVAAPGKKKSKAADTKKDAAPNGDKKKDTDADADKKKDEKKDEAAAKGAAKN
jgi:hypothetical protein